jgi:proline iminopeptidase
MIKTVLKAAGILVLLVAVALAGGLSYRAWRQHQNARMLRITTPNGISEAGFVRVRGVEEWVQIRGEDRNNPVILFLHGGPGYTAIPFNYASMRPWERQFTIVHWDQRGAGRTYIHNGRSHGPDHTIDSMVADGIVMAEYVRRRLHKDKIILVGHSWGSILGTEMARRRPDLFYAYVGTGQVVDIPRNEIGSYWGLMQRVRAAGDKAAEAKLKAIGAPPYQHNEQMGRERDILAKFPPPLEKDWTWTERRTLLFAPGYSLRDSWDMTNQQDMNGTLMNQVMKYDVTARGTTFQIPMFYIQGAEDLMTPTSLVKDYFARVQAPHKELILVPGAGHQAINVASDRFLREMVARVRPWAMPKAPAAAPAQQAATH